jgi:hypothetical protein
MSRMDAAAARLADSVSSRVAALSLSSYSRLIWRAVFVVILIGGFVLFAVGYNHGLPYIDVADEMTIWTMGRAYLDPSWTMFQPQYPPGLLVVSSLIQRSQITFGDPYLNPAGTIQIMRLISITATTITLALCMLLAYRLAGPVAGLAAGLFWMAVPIVVSQAKLATIDPWLWMWFMASVVASIEGWHRKSVGWLAAGLVLAILAALFKWQGAAAFAVPGLSCLAFWSVNRRRMVILMALYAIIVGTTGYWAIFVHHALEGGVYLPGTTTSIPTPATLLVNLTYQFSAIGPFLIYGLLPLVALVLPALIPALRQRLYRDFAIWMLPIVIVLFDLILSFNGAPVFERQYLAATAVLAVLGGVGVSVLVEVASRATSRYRLLWLLPGSVALLTIIIALPLVSLFEQSRQLDIAQTRPDRRASFAEWARTTATDGPLLITNPLVAAAVQTVYGYRGRPVEAPYNEGTSVYVREPAITQQLLDVRNIRYIVASPEYTGENLSTPITRLITYGEDDGWRGDQWAAFYVGALPVLPREQWVTFGEQIDLRGWSLSRQSACPGEMLDLQLLWGASKPPGVYYSAYIHLYGEATGELSLPINGQQLVNDQRPTITWTRPDELLVGPPVAWSLPPDLPPGDYQIWLGVFEPISVSRLSLPGGSDHHVLATIHVADCGQKP